MHARTAALAALSMLVLTLSGCLGGGEEVLDIVVTPADDPITQAYTFTATGTGGRFVWDFGDGSPTAEGRTVEHTYGFTDGTLTVRLTVEVGGGTESLSRKITLGTGQNTPAQIAMHASTDWITPGAKVILSGAASTDADGDPLLYRWTCRRMGDLAPAHNDGHDHGGEGMPLGVQALAVKDSNLTTPETVIEGDLCAGIGEDMRFGRMEALSGAFDGTGVYEVRMEMRDPKMPSPMVGRLHVFVSDSVPDATETIEFSGTLQAGSGCTLQDNIGNDAGQTLDCELHDLTVKLPNKAATIRFSDDSPVFGATYEVLQGNTPIISRNGDAERSLDPGTLRNGARYTVRVAIADGGLQVGYTWTLEIEHDMDPRHVYSEPA